MVERMVRFLDPDAVKSFFEYVSDTPPNPRFVGGLVPFDKHDPTSCIFCAAGFTLGSHVIRPPAASGIIPWDIIRQKLRCSDEIWARIRRLNKDRRGIIQGSIIRGYRRTPTTADYFQSDCISVQKFIKMYGREEYYKLPKSAFMRNGHRKAIRIMALATLVHKVRVQPAVPMIPASKFADVNYDDMLKSEK